MAIFKCKMCGGTLEIKNNETVLECEYCGTQQTIPKLDDEKRANMYDRANHFRRSNEFDKAMGIYEQILNEDNTDAEAYWSLVLCGYGIEYVEDPETHKRVPTVNRAQFTSVFDDNNYKSALQYADSYQKSIYEQEATAINEIQKGILAISQKEEPFDVFICYKETDKDGRRTPDSVLANDLYHQLTNEGFKVFFAAITLEDKLGSAYEPYIFAALNSAKVMVVLGTKPEYFNAVWVKNEWSRYLSLVKNSGGKKIIIPAYKNMDPYDLPEEFSHLQAQDMSKLGFMQDLIRGIKKITSVDESKTTVIKETVVSGDNTNTAPLLKRAFMFLEDGDWRSSNEYCEKVLDINPECAEAYLGKLMAELKVSSRQNLKNCKYPFDRSNNFQKAIRFADENLKKELQGCIDFIVNRNNTDAYNDAVLAMQSSNTEEAYKKASAKFQILCDFKDSKELAGECLEKAKEARLTALYNAAVSAMNNSETENEYKIAAEKFNVIKGFRDSEDKENLCLEKAEEAKEARLTALYNEAELAMNNSKTENEYKIAAEKFNAIKGFRDSEDKENLCLEKAEIPRKEAIYYSAVSSMNKGTILAYEQAIKFFKMIENWKDSSSKIYDCERCISEIKQKENAAKKRRAIAASIVCICIAFAFVLNTYIIPNYKYNNAIALMDSGNMVDAYNAFVDLDDYKDSSDKASSIWAKLNIKEQLEVQNYNIGSYVFFGAYEQDNNNDNGKEDIEWRVLDVKDGKVLLISRYGLDKKPYNTKFTEVTWETCTLRKWLNNDFMNDAFSDEERSMIQTVTVSADKNPEYNTDPGNATEDQVFLLSIEEAHQYFDSDSERITTLTIYADKEGSDHISWWLARPVLIRILPPMSTLSVLFMSTAAVSIMILLLFALLYGLI